MNERRLIAPATAEPSVAKDVMDRHVVTFTG